MGKTHRVVRWGSRAELVNISGDVDLAVDPNLLAVHYAICKVVHDAGLNEEVRGIAATERERGKR